MSFWKPKHGSGFAEAMLASFPSTIMVPEPLRLYFGWLEANSVDEASSQKGERFSRLSPDQKDYAMLVEPVNRDFAVGWSGEDDGAKERAAFFVRTGGDGSYAGIWIDDEGHQHFVHHGSGSGSTLLSVLTSDPIDFLRLLAIGYEELCWSEDFDRTPDQIAELKRDEGMPSSQKPEKLKRWVEATFNVAMPKTAGEIVKSRAEMDDSHSSDPFWHWINARWEGAK